MAKDIRLSGLPIAVEPLNDATGRYYIVVSGSGGGGGGGDASAVNQIAANNILTGISDELDLLQGEFYYEITFNELVDVGGSLAVPTSITPYVEAHLLKINKSTGAIDSTVDLGDFEDKSLSSAYIVAGTSARESDVKAVASISNGTEANYPAGMPDALHSWLIVLNSGSIAVNGMTLDNIGSYDSASAPAGMKLPKPTITGAGTYSWRVVE